MSKLKARKEEIAKMWRDSGFLKDLKGLNKNENIAELFCCKASQLLNNESDNQEDNTKIEK